MASDWDMDTTRRQNKMTETPLRLPTMVPRVLTLGWTSVASQRGNPPIRTTNDRLETCSTQFTE